MVTNYSSFTNRRRDEVTPVCMSRIKVTESESEVGLFFHQIMNLRMVSRLQGVGQMNRSWKHSLPQSYSARQCAEKKC